MKKVWWVNSLSKRILLGSGLALVFFLFLCNWFWALPPKALQPEFSKVYYDRHGQLLSARLTSDDKWRLEGRLNTVSPYLIKALLEFEDKRFYSHRGLDFYAMLRAVRQNLGAGRIISGASTITMQVARLLSPHRRYGSYFGKSLQILRALQLEWRLSKNEILELYFNLAPYGGNIEGVTAASWFYFGKPPSKLNWSEAVALAIAPKSPNRYRPDRFPPAAQNHCRNLVEKLKQKAEIAAEDGWFLECAKPPGQFQALPNEARHLVDRLHSRSGGISNLIWQEGNSKNSQPNHIRTTIDLTLQHQIERSLSGFIRELKGQGVNHAATIIIDNKCGEVLAYVGSPNFNNKVDRGEVDGVRALRSPGSTLKTFLYARALESGDYTPQTLLANVPIKYRGYRPQNFTPGEWGVVHFGEALQQSLNLPAVALNARLGKDKDLLAFLWDAGVSSLPYSRDQYGLSLVLGGGEMRLDELTTLYAALARGGVSTPPTQ